MTQTWTEHRVIKFFIAHVLFVGNPVTALQYSAQLFSKRPSPRILWLRCLRRLAVTVGYANVRTCVAFWSVCSRTCQVTTCIRFFGQLYYDLCTISVNLMFCLGVYATRSPSCSPPARSDQFWSRAGHVLCCGPSGPFFLPLSINVLIVDTRSQLRSCHRLCVSNPKKAQAYINASSSRVESVDHSHLHSCHSEHVANAFTYDNKQTFAVHITR